MIKILKKINKQRIKYFVKRDLLRRRIWSCDIYLTNRCNSCCLNCHIWQQKDKVDLPFSVVEKVISDPLLKKAKFCLHGGEILLYPDHEKLLSLLKGRKYFIVTNGFLDKRLIELVSRYQIPEVVLSLDGRPETNKLIRGVDSHDRILNLIKELKNKTKLTIFYTICQYNDLDDYNYVKKLTKEFDIGFNACLVGNPPFFDINHKLKELEIDKGIIDKEPFIAAFLKWRKGQLNPGCHSIFIYTVIWPDGRVTLCQQKYDVILGNVKKESFKEIWNKPETIALQKQYSGCNDCWLSCHRPLDLIFKK